MYDSVGKVVFDRLFAIVALAILSPLLITVAVLVRLDSRGGVFFQQQRVGRGQRLFNLYKFRTMTVDPDRVLSQTGSHSAGVTRVGRWLRRLKIDELPQLINVLLGDMSLVGPRPCMESHLATMDERGLKRFKVLPGLTGLAQVNGNVALTWPERQAYDAQYVASVSFALDVRILFKTLLVVVAGEQRFKKDKS
ncbi:MAG: sugar transferase [Granulosicoccus sp.]